METSPKGTKSSATLMATAGGSPSGVSILRKRDKSKSPFGAADRFIRKVKDNVDEGVKKVKTGLTLENIASSFAGAGTKRQVKDTVQTAPVGVTHAFSAVLTHIVAPLWSVAAKPLGVQRPIGFKNPEVKDFANSLDADFRVETHADVLGSNPLLATAYITMLLQRILMIERSGSSMDTPFSQIPAALVKEVRYKGDYEEHFNDETVAHDQQTRSLIEVGGPWKPRGATELHSKDHAIRHACLVNALHASVIFKYYYTDEGLQFVVDALAGQLFLLSYSESLVSLMAGIKGSNYVAKYLVQMARPFGELMEQDCIVPTPFVESLLMQECQQLLSAAVENLCHRNDTSDVVITAMTRAVGLCPSNAHTSLFAFFDMVLHMIYAVDLQCVSQLLDAVRPFLVHPVPVGSTALTLVQSLRTACLSANVLQRSLASTLFVAGAEMKSFRLQPAHIVTAPYCARSEVYPRIFLDVVPQQRSSNPHLLALTGMNRDPVTMQHTECIVDDAVLYLANQSSNTFQALLELAPPASTKPAPGQAQPQLLPGQEIELANLFSVLPASLCALYPKFHELLANASLGEYSKTSEEVRETIAAEYAHLMDMERPAKGVRKFRLESPRVPFLPLLATMMLETDEQNETVKTIIDKHWRYCDQRVGENEAASVHPKRDLSLSHFIESHLRVIVAGGGGLLRRLITSLLSMRINYPGAVPDFRLYLLPLGYENDLPSWLARNDPIYMQEVFSPIMCQPIRSGDQPTQEAMNQRHKDSFESLALRRRINNYLVHARQQNEVVVYQAECVMQDGTVNYIPFVSGLEVGIHLAAIAKQEGGTIQGSREVVSSTSFAVDSGTMPGLARQKTQASLSRQKSSVSDLFSPTSVSNASFSTGVSQNPLNSGAFGPMDALSVQQHISFGATTETLERVLVRMHGSRGVPLATRKHLTDAGDVHGCAAGVDILDWISTTYHVYDSSIAVRAAQALLDTKLITCVCVPLGKEPNKFSDSGLYCPCPREDVDAAPTCAPAQRTRSWEQASAIRHALHEEPLYGTNAPAMRLRVVFFGLESDNVYTDLNEGAQIRDIATLKLKSTGSNDDRGSLPSPLNTHLHMTISEVEKRRPGRERTLTDKYDHYQLRFGEKMSVEQRCMLVVEAKPANPTNPYADAAGQGLYAAIDGDIFGPFNAVRVRPVTIKPTAERPNCNVATVSMMSFVKCHDRVD